MIREFNLNQIFQRGNHGTRGGVDAERSGDDLV